MSNRYRVTWVIDLEASSPREAAQQALAIQRNPESIATVFEVSDDTGEAPTTVDLTYDTKL